MSGAAEVHSALFVQCSYVQEGEWGIQGFAGVEECYLGLWKMSKRQKEDLIR